MNSKLQAQMAFLRKAVDRLDEVLQQPVNPFIRDSAVQRFEFSFEILWKTLKTYLESSEGLEARSPRECLKGAFKVELIEEDPFWLETITLRNLTTHTYVERVADRIYSALPGVLKNYRMLASRLQDRVTAS